VAFLKISEAPVAERYLYIPSVGYAIFLGGLFCLGAEKTPIHRKIVIGCALLLLGLYGIGTIHRNLVWSDDVRLWSDAVRKSPHEGLPWTELGMAYNANNDTANALSCFQNAIAANYDREGRSIAHNNLGMIYLREKDIEMAKTHFQASIRERPGYPTPHYGLGLAHMEGVNRAASLEAAKTQAEKAAEAFRKAIDLNPNYIRALWGLIRSYAAMGDLAQKEGDTRAAVTKYRSAIQTFDNLTRIDGKFSTAHPKKAALVENLRKNVLPKLQ
jgi:tetratricopeptide (TPR) repeat protein